MNSEERDRTRAKNGWRCPGWGEARAEVRSV